jgi:hypothetical protein
MPSTMVHLMVAREVEPTGGALFWVGNFAPDCVTEREKKDPLHLRDRTDRWAALTELREALDPADPLARGWLLHLFTDTCWDAGQIGLFRAWHARKEPGADWFVRYRAEIARATFWLYRALPWAEGVMGEIANADLSAPRAALPVPTELIKWYRDRVVERHTGSDPDSAPLFYERAALDAFARETAGRYIDWMNGR